MLPARHALLKGGCKKNCHYVIAERNVPVEYKDNKI